MRATIQLPTAGLCVVIFSILLLIVTFRWGSIFGHAIVDSTVFSLLLPAVSLLMVFVRRRHRVLAKLYSEVFACFWLPWLSAYLAFIIMTMIWKTAQPYSVALFLDSLVIGSFMPYLGSYAWLSTLGGIFYVVIRR
jgi:hypothetical protein